ncbi:prepilin-type N-terminal cleavage/methylation domain-containing protein [Acinetobacter sp. C32I]|uniref:type IV pilin protein n=1 Tax=Acinetobacter sp. C32I TaxID=2950074 RepID=UPI0020375523|nr:prepilin-type N-terminal cleavage/methylation domain-containing protein [Acinetobacter sp. C32I]USA52352.1 prepilin-type N-terminal cleavage/methylation domain-containing protein [Acinetobacter sp. C32I]
MINIGLSRHPHQFNRGFTLIELMVALVVIAVIIAIAIPSYQYFTRRAVAAQAQQEVYKLAEQLERHKLKNFTYRGFSARYLYPAPPSPRVDSFAVATQTLSFPLESNSPQYTIRIKDGGNTNPLLTAVGALGQSWVITATSSDVKNFSYLLTSTGVKCKTLTPANININPGTSTPPAKVECGVGSEDW